MLTPLETGEKLGIYHLVKILQTTCCTFVPATKSYQLQPPLQGQLAHYMVSQVSLCPATLSERLAQARLCAGHHPSSFDLALGSQFAS